MSIEKHENKYFHIPKKAIGIILYLLVSFGCWGYLVYRCSQYPDFNDANIAVPFAILFFVILALPISYWGRD